MNKEELIALTKEHIHEATHYNVDFLKKVYSDNVMYVMVNEKDQVSTMSKSDLITYFTSRRDQGLAPLGEDSDFLYANADDHTAMVIVNREMEFNNRPEKMFFTLIWEKTASGWKIAKESVSVKPI
ncbi:hypothetical protein [Sinomicrobium sp. M5D2P17]